METSKNQLIAQKIETGIFLLWSVTFLSLPLVYTTYTTDPFILPKLFLLAGVILVSLLAWGVKMLVLGQVRIRRTPLDIPVLLFGLAVILSSVFAVNRYDSLIAATSFIFAVLAYFILVNMFHTKKVAVFFLSSLVTGIVLASTVTVLAHFKMYVLPFVSSHTPNFTPMGNYVSSALYIAAVLPLALAFVVPLFKKKLTERVAIFSLASLAIIAGMTVIVSGLFTNQKPTLLPFDTGFQTSFAAISQDSGRVLQSFFFGAGYGNYASVFTRFHPASFNANQQLWFLAFNTSSSYLLELLATTGFVGALAYLFLLFKTITPIAKKKSNPFFFSLLVLFVASVVLPFSILEVSLLFIFLAGFTLYQREHVPHEYFDIELKFVALKKGVFAFTTLDDAAKPRRDLHATPITAFIVFLALAVLLGFYSIAYAMSDVTFQQSLSAASKNNGTATYKLQAEAIAQFPYRGVYYRIFSQTNIALANSLLSLSSGSKSSPSATAQQTAFTLVQQGITTAQAATKLAPLSVDGWQNLSSVYRSLIGVGQNAQDFAVSAARQAVMLDSANPQEYLTLGGLYYQLGQYDNAIRMFQQAINLKSDYANAYYNLGHAYEQKGDLPNALVQYQTVQSLVSSDKTNYDRITSEIQALQAKIGSAGQQPAAKPSQATGTQQQPLSLPGQTQPTQPVISPAPTK